MQRAWRHLPEAPPALRHPPPLPPASKPPLLLPTSSCPSLPCPQPFLPLPPTSPPNPTLQRPLPASAGTNPARRQPPHRVVGCRQSASPLLPLPQPPADALAALAPPPCVLPLHPLQFSTSQTAPLIRWICPTDLNDPPGCTNPGPGRLAQKMSVMSVEPPARGAPGGIAA